MSHVGLIGKTLKHSFSQAYFTAKFEREGLPYRYELYELPEIGNFSALWEDPLLMGVNVTIPYKEAVIPYLARLDASAAAVGAVNTILRTPGGLVGYNTDVFGLEASLRPWVDARPELCQRPALIVGTGGAAKAADWVLRERLHIDKVWWVSRSPSFRSLRGPQGPKGPQGPEIIAYTDPALPEVIAACGLVIQASPVGMYPAVAEAPALPYAAFGPQHACMDLIYNPEETQFMQQCRERGAAVQNGLAMLYAQAEKAWEVWNRG